ncbi:hypothetical protein BCR32DRAFT_246167 [Anaeromyces robustus]|uniref:G-protein coupled receptors family 1 profile domain-containing protein n=1 Tax=Anaeromyces robustus TaxID=1754192 RepID=A0A1Y1X203_9FUNG|nr:hypothetical protein BCR32DRAFT_246167 [Anaeromyces robustus]|eukprot:ORX79722.1 hypothetical protein BCR32DRAFT_246167 [Anaeromyces robustus]
MTTPGGPPPDFSGQPGSQGPQGQQGPPGPPGSSGFTTSFSTTLFISQISMMLKESLFYCGLIQFVIVLYIYLRIGKGKLWMTFLYSTLCMFSGKVLEYIMRSLIFFKETSKYAFICCIPLETFYIASNYTLAYINLIKLKALTEKQYVKKIQILVSLLFPIFCTFRYLIGYYRYIDSDFNSSKARNCKGISYSILASLNIFISFFIYRELKHNYRKERSQSNYLKKITFPCYIRRSNYAVLLFLNICSFILSFLNYSYISGLYVDLITLLECIQDNLIFLLAVDTLIYKADYFKMLNSQGATVGNKHYRNTSNNSSNSKASLVKNMPFLASYNSSNNILSNNSSHYYGNLSHSNRKSSGSMENYNPIIKNDININHMNYNVDISQYKSKKTGISNIHGLIV